MAQVSLHDEIFCSGFNSTRSDHTALIQYYYPEAWHTAISILLGSVICVQAIFLAHLVVFSSRSSRSTSRRMNVFIMALTLLGAMNSIVFNFAGGVVVSPLDVQGLTRQLVTGWLRPFFAVQAYSNFFIWLALSCCSNISKYVTSGHSHRFRFLIFTNNLVLLLPYAVLLRHLFGLYTGEDCHSFAWYYRSMAMLGLISTTLVAGVVTLVGLLVVSALNTHVDFEVKFHGEKAKLKYVSLINRVKRTTATFLGFGGLVVMAMVVSLIWCATYRTFILFAWNFYAVDGSIIVCNTVLAVFKYQNSSQRKARFRVSPTAGKTEGCSSTPKSED